MKLRADTFNPNITPPKPTHLGRFAAWLVLIVIVAGYFGLVAGSAINLPYADDYEVILDFVSKTVEHGFSWPAVWEEHNEHRLVFTRLAALGLWKISSHIDFRILILMGNLGWLACGAMLGTVAVRRANSIWAAVPVAAILAVPIHHENMLWAMASVQNYWLAAFAVACVWLISANRIWRGLVSLGAATITSGGALVLMPCILGGLLFQRKWKQAGLISVVCASIVSVYFIGHHSVSKLHATNFGTIPLYVINFLGSFSPWPGTAPFIGAVLIVVLVLIAWRCRKDTLVGMLSLFILMTALVAAWSRGGMGAAQGLASRYSLFPLLGLVSVWLAWLQYVRPRHTVLVSSGAMLVALAISSTFGVFEKTRWQHQRVAMLLEYFQVTNGYASHAHIVHFLDDARRSRIYSAPAGKSLIGALHAEPTSETTESAQTEVRGCVDVFDGSYLLGWAHFPHLSAARQRLSIILKSTAGMWTIPATYYDRPDLDPVFHDGGNYLNSGFQVMLPLYDVPPGSYRIGILIRNGGQSGILWVEQVYVASSPSSRRLCSEG